MWLSAGSYETASTHLNILHDHYKESFALIREREKQRNSLFIKLIVILGILFLEVQYPNNIQELFQSIDFSQTKISLNSLPIYIVTSVTWTIFLITTLRHCQESITVEREYKYLHKLEGVISHLLGNSPIYNRESQAYLVDYPAFSNWIYQFHTYIFPIIIFILLSYLIYIEFNTNHVVVWVYDFLMALGVFLSLFLYRGLPIVRILFHRLKVRH